MWEKYLEKIFDDLDIVYNLHECSIYGSTIDGKVVLVCPLSLGTTIL
jgi:hypothetical protein